MKMELDSPLQQLIAGVVLVVLVILAIGIYHQASAQSVAIVLTCSVPIDVDSAGSQVAPTAWELRKADSPLPDSLWNGAQLVLSRSITKAIGALDSFNVSIPKNRITYFKIRSRDATVNGSFNWSAWSNLCGRSAGDTLAPGKVTDLR